MVLGIISIGLWVVTILGFIFRNLWVRNNKLEKMLNEQTAFIQETKQTIEVVTKTFDEIDQENIFRSNDYVGQMWLNLKSLNEVLKNYK
jgi:hypothetical protein